MSVLRILIVFALKSSGTISFLHLILKISLMLSDLFAFYCILYYSIPCEVMTMQYVWPAFGAASIILGIVNIFVSLRGKKNTAIKLLVIGLICGMLALLSQYALVDYWVGKSDWSALSDVAPGMYNVLTIAVLLVEALNVAAAMIIIKRRK